VEDRAPEEPVERRRQDVEPLDCVPVLTQCSVLRRQSVALRVVGGQAEAANAPKGVAGEGLQPVEGALRELPQRSGTLAAELGPGDVVRDGTAAQREAAVPAARSTRHGTGLVQPNAETASCEGESAGASRHTPADDYDVDRAGRPSSRDRIRMLFEPI
jgi:hypothetical protein